MSSFAKSLIAFLFVSVVLGLLYLGDPPQNRCSWQRSDFLVQTGQLLISSGIRGKRSPKLIASMTNCRDANSVGGCRQFFEILNQLNFHMRNIPKDCSGYFVEISDLLNLNWQAVQLISELAWGAAGPQSVIQRQGWLGASEMATFCDLKQNQIKLVGEESWNNHVVDILHALPGIKKIGENESWNRSIFSYRCQI